MNMNNLWKYNKHNKLNKVISDLKRSLSELL